MLAAKNSAELSPVLQKVFGFTPEKADAVAAIYDARARTWAAEDAQQIAHQLRASGIVKDPTSSFWRRDTER